MPEARGGLLHDLGHGRLTEFAPIRARRRRTELRMARLFQPVAVYGLFPGQRHSGIAFLVMSAEEYARAAQRRPGAGHRARPGAVRLPHRTWGWYQAPVSAVVLR